MADYMPPFTWQLNLADGTIPGAVIQTRHLSDMKGLYADPSAEAALLADDPVIYRYYEATPTTPKVPGQLCYSTSVIYPGKVGDEYFMTKGHYHALGDRAEVYYGLIGEGYLLLMTPEGKVNVQPMKPGAAAYVPPYWAHRTINVGKENFVFLAVYPADAGYDYGTIAEKGFASIVVELDGKPQVVSNPRYKGA